MKLVNTLCLTLAVALVCSVAVAQETSSEAKQCTSQCQSSASAVATATDKDSCDQCPVSAAMKNLPAMTYKVGDEATCCSTSADALAKEHSKPIHFVVGKKTFEDKQQAYTALVESTEKFVNDFITPSKCEKSGMTSIAGASCGCPVDAGKKTELVKKAVSDIKMTYVVGEKECNCPTQAKSLAAANTEAKTKYVVSGKETCCNLEARLNLAKARYAAAVKALAATPKKEEKAAASSS